ncbi:DUF814 domain-containing protein, partial [bacterium]|nr:DUF814 domain-containing protein [bacterium]
VENILSKLKDKSLKNIYNALIDFINNTDYSPSVKNDFSSFSVHSEAESFDCNSFNDMIDIYFSYHQQKEQMKNLKNKISGYLQQQLKKLKTLKAKQQEQINKIEKANIYKQKADILMANLYYIPSGSKNITLNDFEGNPIDIDLDENKSAKENANRYYALYKKAKSANEHAKELISQTNSQILYFEELLYYTEKAEIYSELEDINKEIFQEKIEEKSNNIPVEAIDYMGYKIFVGKNKKQNDYILSKLSSSNDLWFHLLNAAGAHALIKTNGIENIPDKVLLKAAQLVKENSSQKDNSKTSVIYTMRKYVKKANNKMAFVTYKNESEIVI